MVAVEVVAAVSKQDFVVRRPQPHVGMSRQGECEVSGPPKFVAAIP